MIWPKSTRKPRVAWKRPASSRILPPMSHQARTGESKRYTLCVLYPSLMLIATALFQRSTSRTTQMKIKPSKSLCKQDVCLLTRVQAFVSIRREIRKVSIHNLKAIDNEEFLGNLFRIFFKYLSELCTTNTSEDSINRAYHRRTSIDSNTTEMSTSSAEGKDEGVSAGSMGELIKYILHMMGDERRLPTGQNDNLFLKCFAATTRLEFQVARTSTLLPTTGLPE